MICSTIVIYKTISLYVKTESLYSEHQFLRNCGIFKRTLAVRIVVAYRLAVTGSLRYTYSSGNRNLEKLVRVVFFELGYYLSC